MLRREGNTLSPIIRQAWDRGDLRSLTKNSSAVATDAHVSILGHITRAELNEYLSQTEMFNGFANRFLWGLVKRSKLLPDGGQAIDLEAVKQGLALAQKAASGVHRMTRSAAAIDLWHLLYPELTAERPGLYGAVTGRGEAQTLRLSMIYALFDGSAVIDTPHLQAAVAVWDYCDASAKIIFDGHEDPLEQLLLDAIKRTPGISRKGLYRAVGGHIPAEVMALALANIRDRGLVRCTMQATGGRPAECWHPCESISDGRRDAQREARPSGRRPGVAVAGGLSSLGRGPMSARPADEGVAQANASTKDLSSLGRNTSADVAQADAKAMPCVLTNKVPASGPADLSSGFVRNPCEQSPPLASAGEGCVLTNKVPGHADAQPADLSSLGRKALQGDAQADGQVEATAIIVDAPVSGSMALADLLQAVNRIGGRLSNSDGKISIELPGGSVPPELAAALTYHDEALRALLPCKAMPMPKPVADAKGEEMSVDDFLAELRAVGSAVAQVDPCPELDRLFEA